MQKSKENIIFCDEYSYFCIIFIDIIMGKCGVWIIKLKERQHMFCYNNFEYDVGNVFFCKCKFKSFKAICETTLQFDLQKDTNKITFS